MALTLTVVMSVSVSRNQGGEITTLFIDDSAMDRDSISKKFLCAYMKCMIIIINLGS